MLDFVIAGCTDVGTKKKVNQDAYFAGIADTEVGPVTFAVVCDGMGGLSNGEKASAIMAKASASWFHHGLATRICKGHGMVTAEEFRKEMDALVQQAGVDIAFASEKETGTTMAGILCGAGLFYTVCVGDSRIYKIANEKRDPVVEQLTHDQSLVQKLLDNGEITKEEAKKHKMRNRLLQCVGASEIIVPGYTSGTYKRGDIFLLCSDGFWHHTDEYILPKIQEATKSAITPEDSRIEMEAWLREQINECKDSGEIDNITAVSIQTVLGSI